MEKLFAYKDVIFHVCSFSWVKLALKGQNIVEMMKRFLIWKDSVTHGWSRLLRKGRTSYTRIIRLKILMILIYVSDCLYFIVISFYSFKLSSSVGTVLNAFSSNLDKVFSVSCSSVFHFIGFNLHHYDWLTCSGRTDTSGKLCYNFLRHLASFLFFRWVRGLGEK